METYPLRTRRVPSADAQRSTGRSRPCVLATINLRIDLRNLLLDALEPNTVQWGKGLDSVRVIDDTTYELNLTDGTTFTTPILIGADGAFSKITPLLHSVRPPYSGVTMYDMQIPAAAMSKQIRERVGTGALWILGQGKGIMLQMNSSGKCKIYAALNVDHKYVDENPLPKVGSRRNWIKTMYPGWDALVEEVIDACEEETIVPRRIYAYDPKHTWTTNLKGVTLMGE